MGNRNARRGRYCRSQKETKFHCNYAAHKLRHIEKNPYCPSFTKLPSPTDTAFIIYNAGLTKEKNVFHQLLSISRSEGACWERGYKSVIII